MKKITILLLMVVIYYHNSIAFSPKRELRGAWISTVYNNDWPYSGNTLGQQQELISLLSELKDIGINAVIFQIRPESDALYYSDYEPWSYWLTGEQGKAPDPYYDPLAFVIEEAHKLGLELHAWFNPYRAEASVGSYTTTPQHVTNQHPDWIIQIGIRKVCCE